MLAAVLSTLSFLGHWSLQVDVPFTNQYLVIVPSAPDHGPGAAQTHEDHCHASAATCTDIPFTGVSPFLMMRASVAYFGAAAILIATAALWWVPAAAARVAPELRPPRLRQMFQALTSA